ncbi:MAG: hypothetical protein GWP05_04080 [Anaerolineaceae bacterium]|nr:hypothetical protein [Anaerolineaceae bacterium]
MKVQTFLLVVSVLIAPLAAGCFSPATMYADTRTLAKDGFTNKSPQWAYQGEPVTFDFAPDYGLTDYAVFYLPDGSRRYVDKRQTTDTGPNYRAVGTFKAGREPRTYTIEAIAFNVRRQNDWYWDKDDKQWVYHRTQGDQPDFKVGSAKMEVICYRVEIRIQFSPGSRRVADIVMVLLKGDGSRTRRRLKVGDEPGLEIIGPDNRGKYSARYVPKWNEVNRVGKTDVELQLTFGDGTQQVIRREIDTP